MNEIRIFLFQLKSLLHVRKIYLQLFYHLCSFRLLRIMLYIAKIIKQFKRKEEKKHDNDLRDNELQHLEQHHNYRYVVILVNHRDVNDHMLDKVWLVHLELNLYQMN